MSSISLEEFIADYGFDPDDTEPLRGPNQDRSEWPDDRTARGVLSLADGENQYWLERLVAAGVVPTKWEPRGEPALAELWNAVLEELQRRPLEGCGWREIASNPPVPLWLRLEPGYDKYVGVDGSRLIGGVIAAICRWMEESWRAKWVVLPSYGGLSPASIGLIAPMGRGIEPFDVIPRMVWGAATGQARDSRPESLSEWVRLFEPGTGGDAVVDGGAEADLVLEPWEGSGRWNWGLSTDDVTAHMEEERYENLAVLLGREPGIEDCIHEDRELILFRSDFDHDTLIVIVNLLWDGTATS